MSSCLTKRSRFIQSLLWMVHHFLSICFVQRFVFVITVTRDWFIAALAMWPLLAYTDGIAWSDGRLVCQTISTIRPWALRKRLKWSRCSLGCGLGWVERTMYLRGPEYFQIPAREGALLGMKLGFSCTPPSTVPSGHDIGISPRAVDQRSDWPAAQAVECHIEFSQWKISLRCGLSWKFFDCLFIAVALVCKLGLWYSL